MPNTADQDGAVSAAETNNETQTPAPAQPQRQPRTREGGQQQRDDRPRSLHDDFNRQQPTWWGQNGMSLLFAVTLIAVAILLYKAWTDHEERKQALALAGVTQVENAVVPPPAPAPAVVTPPPAPVAPLDPAAALALMGAPGSGFVSGSATGRGPQVFSLQETNLPGIGKCYMVNVTEKRGISAPPGTAIPAPEYQMANPPQGLRWVATDKPDPNRPGAVYYVLAP